MAKTMSFDDFVKSSPSTDQNLVLDQFIPDEESDKLGTAIDPEGTVHVVSKSNLSNALEAGVAAKEGTAIILKGGSWSKLNGMTVSSLGKTWSAGSIKRPA